MPDETGQEQAWRRLAAEVIALAKDPLPKDGGLEPIYTSSKAAMEFPVVIQDRWMWRVAYEHMRNTAIKQLGAINGVLTSEAKTDVDRVRRHIKAMDACDDALRALIDLTKVLEPETYADDVDRRWLADGTGLPQYSKDRA